jgi:hypothetical protein
VKREIFGCGWPLSLSELFGVCCPSGIGEITNRPTFYFRPVRDGYQIGIHVQGEWWKLHSTQLVPALRDLPLSCGNDIVLGLLPYLTGHFW